MADSIREANMFMKITGDFEGESEDSKHLKWIEIDSWDCGYTQPGTPKKGEEAGTIDRARHKPFNVQKKVDSASASIKKACWAGKKIPTIMIECFRSANETASTTPYLVIELSDVMINDYSLKTSNGELPNEDLQLSYNKIKFTYRPMDKATGTFNKVTEASHDRATNTVT